MASKPINLHIKGKSKDKDKKPTPTTTYEANHGNKSGTDINDTIIMEQKLRELDLPKMISEEDLKKALKNAEFSPSKWNHLQLYKFFELNKYDKFLKFIKDGKYTGTTFLCLNKGVLIHKLKSASAGDGILLNNVLKKLRQIEDAYIQKHIPSVPTDLVSSSLKEGRRIVTQIGGNEDHGRGTASSRSVSSNISESVSASNSGFFRTKQTPNCAFDPRGGRGGINCPGVASRSCFTCHEGGHISRDCPKAQPITCFNYNEQGHVVRNCPKSQRGNNGSGLGRGRGGKFTRVNIWGTKSSIPTSDMTNYWEPVPPPVSKSTSGTDEIWYYDPITNISVSQPVISTTSEDNGDGETSKTVGSSGNSGRSQAVDNCYEEGHIAKDCIKCRTVICFKCNGKGHMAGDCPYKKGPKGSCNKCDTFGHKARDCPKDRATNYYGSGDSGNIRLNNSYNFLAEGRNLVDETISEKAKLVFDPEQLKKDYEDSRINLDKKTKEFSVIQEQLSSLQKEVDDLTREASSASSERDRLADERKNLDAELDHLKREVEYLRKSLESETMKRVDAENKLKSKTQELTCKFQQQQEMFEELHSRRYAEIKDEVGGQIQQDYEHKLEISLQELRSEYESQVIANKEELEGLYEQTVSGLRNQLLRLQNSSSNKADEVRELSHSITSLQSEIQSLESEPAALNDQLKEIRKKINEEQTRVFKIKETPAGYGRTPRSSGLKRKRDLATEECIDVTYETAAGDDPEGKFVKLRNKEDKEISGKKMAKIGTQRVKMGYSPRDRMGTIFGGPPPEEYFQEDGDGQGKRCTIC